MRQGGGWPAQSPIHQKLGMRVVGPAVRPTDSMVVTTVQKLWRATRGEVVCTTA